MDSTAILARTNLALRPFEAALSEAQIPFHYINRAGFFAQPEIRAGIDYLSAVVYPANHVISGVLRTDFHPTRYLPRTKIQTLFKELKAQDEDVSYWKLLCEEPQTLVDSRNLEAIRNLTQFIHGLSRYRSSPPAEALKQILGLLKVGDYYSEIETPDNDPLANLADLLKIAGKHSDIKGFLDYCRRVTAASKSKRGVSLATCHAAKGLEFSRVFMVQCTDGMFPHAKSTDLQEERAIWFTGCSRAERELIITYSGNPSPFIKSCGILETKCQTTNQESPMPSVL